MVFVHSKKLKSVWRSLLGASRGDTLHPYRTSLWLKGWILSFLVLLILLLVVYLWFEYHRFSETHRQFMTRAVNDVARQMRITLDKNTRSLELLVLNESPLVAKVVHESKERQEAWHLLHNKLRILFSKSAVFALTDIYQTPLFMSSTEQFLITPDNRLTGCKSQDEWVEYSVYWTLGSEHGFFIACESMHIFGERLKVFKTDTFSLVLLNRKKQIITQLDEPEREELLPASSDETIIREPLEGKRWYVAAIPNRSLVRKNVMDVLRHIGGIYLVFLSLCSFLAYRLLVLDRKRQQAEEAWWSLQMHAQATLASIGEGVVVTDSDRIVLYMNSVAEKITAWKLEQAEKQPLERLLPIQNCPPTRFSSEEGEFNSVPIRHHMTIQPGESVLHVEVSSTAIESEWGSGSGIVWVLRDVTGEKRAMQELSESEERYRTLFENSFEGIMITDPRGMIVRINSAFTRITGYSFREVFGKNANILRSGRHDADFFKSLWNILGRSGYWNGEIWNKRKSGELYPERLSISAIRNKEGVIQNYVGILEDITEKKQREEKIQHLAYYDPLTDLPNRVLFQERLKRALVQARRNNRWVGLLFLDLDKFKAINDTMGHPAGDQLLRLVAERLKNCVREEDTVVRMGGDEFILILVNMKPDARAKEGGQKVAHKVLRALGEPFSIGGTEVVVGASVGIALYPQDGETATQLLRNADSALYYAKALGRNNAQFYTEEIHLGVT
ncbi:MAG: diguanylate cyclase [Gammaproteobacteria bacterium]|nr:diguanylate cyclase [Gammaproteobacteria bacterium]